MTGPLSVAEAREQIEFRLREVDELWAAIRYVAPEVRRPLTVSQRAVARAFAWSNLSAREIARERGVSVNTIKSQIRVAYAVLGVRRRGELRQALIAAERVPEVPQVGAT